MIPEWFSSLLFGKARSKVLMGVGSELGPVDPHSQYPGQRPAPTTDSTVPRWLSRLLQATTLLVSVPSFLPPHAAPVVLGLAW